jgi:phage I-like protein
MRIGAAFNKIHQARGGKVDAKRTGADRREFLKMLFNALEVSPEIEPGEISEERAIELIKALVRRADDEKNVEELIEQAVARGGLLATERGMARNTFKIALGGDIEAFKVFLGRRNAVAVLGSARSTSPEISETQREMNAKLGISQSVFEKYNPPARKPGFAEIDEAQAAINRQVGVSPETFLKYNEPRRIYY